MSTLNVQLHVYLIQRWHRMFLTVYTYYRLLTFLLSLSMMYNCFVWSSKTNTDWADPFLHCPLCKCHCRALWLPCLSLPAHSGGTSDDNWWWCRRQRHCYV